MPEAAIAVRVGVLGTLGPNAPPGLTRSAPLACVPRMTDEALDPEVLRDAKAWNRSYEAVKDALRLAKHWVEEERQPEGIDVTRSAIFSQLALLNPLAEVDVAVGEALTETRRWVEMTFSLKKQWRSSYHSMADARERVLEELATLRERVEASPYRPKSA